MENKRFVRQRFQEMQPCPAGGDAKAAEMKTDNWACAAESAGSRAQAAHLDCPVPALPAGGLTDRKSTHLLTLIRSQNPCEDIYRKLSNEFSVELHFEILHNR